MYNDQHGHGGGYGGGNKFGDKRFSGGDKPLFKATCAKCGNTCEVPFKPNGSKPVFCRDCFKKDAGFEPRRSGPLDVGGGSRPSFGDRGDRPSYGGDREMFQATCATCGGRCEVPFRPSGDKPIYCKACFGGKPGNGPAPRPTENYAEQFKAINVKLDALLKVIAPAALTAPVVAKAPVAVVKAPVVVAKSPAPAPKAEKPAVIVEKPAVKKAEKAEKPAKAEKKAEKKAPAKKAKK
jgi:CxxC-x17-CxxC domain-containing protein